MLKIFGNQLSWDWDDRFETVLAEFSATDKKSVHDIIKTYMGDIWNGGNSGDAPEVIKMIIDYFGGLNPGQQLFSSDPNQDGLFLCAWWPWGNGKTISIRIGVFADSLSNDDNQKLSMLFKGWFGV